MVEEEKIGGGGGERRCAGMEGEPTDSNTEETVADSMEAEGGEAAEEELVPTGCCCWHWRCHSLPLAAALAAADFMGLTSQCQTG